MRNPPEKMTDQELDQKTEQLIPIYRITGWVVLIAGVCISPFIIFYAMDAQETAGSKIGSIAFALVLPLIGAVFAFNPKKRIISSIRPFMRKACEMTQSDVKLG